MNDPQPNPATTVQPVTGGLLTAPPLVPTPKVSLPTGAAVSAQQALRAAVGADELSNEMVHITDEAVFATGQPSSPDDAGSATLHVIAPYFPKGQALSITVEPPGTGPKDLFDNCNFHFLFGAGAAADAGPPDMQFGFVLLPSGSAKLMSVTPPVSERAAELASLGFDTRSLLITGTKILAGTVASAASAVAGGNVTIKQALIDGLTSTAVDLANALIGKS